MRKYIIVVVVTIIIIIAVVLLIISTSSSLFHYLYHLNYQMHNYLTRNAYNLKIVFAWTNMRKFSISCRGPLTWNSAPESIKDCTSLDIFEHQLQDWLLSD